MMDLLEGRDLPVGQPRYQRDLSQRSGAIEQPGVEPRGQHEHLAIPPRLGQSRGADVVMHVDVAVGLEPDRTILAERGQLQHLAERAPQTFRSDGHTSELQSLMRLSYAAFCST